MYGSGFSSQSGGARTSTSPAPSRGSAARLHRPIRWMSAATGAASVTSRSASRSRPISHTWVVTASTPPSAPPGWNAATTALCRALRSQRRNRL